MPSLMKASELRASLLQEAVSGRLVPQMDSDGSAADLLQEIAAERAALVAAGKLKKEKPLPAITEEEIPFEIPESWEWVRLGDLGIFQGGHTPSMNNPEFWGGEIVWVTSKDMKTKYISSSQLTITKKGADTLTIYPSGTLLMVVRSGILRRTFPISILTHEATINQDLKAFRLYMPTLSEFIYYFLKGLELEILKSYIKNITTVESVKFEEFKLMPFPLPPLSEQHRIVAKLEELMPLVDAYEKEEEALSKLNAGFPESLRKSILQEAVSGKLVPQLTEEGSAADLLKEIAAERAALVAAGKMKKEKPLPAVSEDEVPFPIPENWRWMRLGEIIYLLSGRDLDDSAYSDSEIGIPYLTGASNISDGRMCIERWTNSPQVIAEKGDLLLSCKGTVGKTVILTIDKIHIARQIMALRPIIGLDVNYLKIFIDMSVNELIGMARSMIPGISRSHILDLYIPLPPLTEQHRIVAKVDELMKIVDKIASGDKKHLTLRGTK